MPKLSIILSYALLLSLVQLPAEISSYTGYELSDFEIINTDLDWNSARIDCVDRGGHLAVIRSQKEQNEYIIAMLRGNVLRVWLGVHDIFKEGAFTTVLDEELESVNYTKWADFNTWKQPDNGGGTYSSQNCVTLVNRGEAGMDDFTCDSKLPYICKYDQYPADIN